MTFAQPGVPVEVAVLAAVWPQFEASISARANRDNGAGLCVASPRDFRVRQSPRCEN